MCKESKEIKGNKLFQEEACGDRLSQIAKEVGNPFFNSIQENVYNTTLDIVYKNANCLSCEYATQQPNGDCLCSSNKMQIIVIPQSKVSLRCPCNSEYVKFKQSIDKMLDEQYEKLER